jgi:DNA-binding transcriptional MerR regulator
MLQVAAMHKIGKAAALAGTTPRTLKWYEELELLPRSERTPGGFRLYSDDDVVAIQRIQKMQGLGLSLQLIREVLKQEQTVDAMGRRRLSTATLMILLQTLEAQRADVSGRIGKLQADLAAGQDLLTRLDSDLAILRPRIATLIAEEKGGVIPPAPSSTEGTPCS